MGVAYTTNCAGQGCEEAVRCRRFQMRMPAPAEVATPPEFEWASFDIERAAFGDCANFVKYHERRN